MKKQIKELEIPADFLDFHSHVLPAIDDGSRDVETSLEMLKILWSQGVKRVIATPHFDATRLSPNEFLQKRDESEQILRKAMDESGDKDRMPELLTGAEVFYFQGISSSEAMKELCVSNTSLLLLEMPFCPWSRSEVEEVLTIREKLNVIPVLAHLDRYFPFQKKAVLNEMLSGDVLVQINADAFLNGKTARKAFKLMDSGRIDFLGSDCHNLSSRGPNFDKAVEVISKKKRSASLSDIYKSGNEFFKF